MNIIKFIHLLAGTAILGVVISTWIYYFRNKKPFYLILSECVILLLIPIQFITGTFLVKKLHYSFLTPWIVAAYILLGIIAILCFLTLYLKRKYYYLFEKSFLVINVIIVILLFLIIHDAVMKATL